MGGNREVNNVHLKADHGHTMELLKTDAPVVIKPEVLNAKRDGDRYRAQSTGMSGRGW